MIGPAKLYRDSAERVADLLARHAALERQFVRLTPSLWRSPGVGRLFRSVGYRLIERLRDAGGADREVLVAGTPMRVDITHWMFTELYFTHAPYEAATTAYLKRHLLPGAVFLDIGANGGYFSLLAAARVGPAGRVVAFEPNPRACGELRRHVALNGFTERVEVCECALSNASCEGVPLYVPEQDVRSGFASLQPETPQGREYLASASAVPVHTRTLDDWVEGVAIETMDIVKIDVEGAEDHVLEGMTRTLAAGRIGRLVCETEWDSTMHRRMVASGYVPEVLEEIGPILNIAYCRAERTEPWRNPTAEADAGEESRRAAPQRS